MVVSCSLRTDFAACAAFAACALDLCSSFWRLLCLWSWLVLLYPSSWNSLWAVSIACSVPEPWKWMLMPGPRTALQLLVPRNCFCVPAIRTKTVLCAGGMHSILEDLLCNGYRGTQARTRSKLQCSKGLSSGTWDNNIVLGPPPHPFPPAKVCL